MNFIQYSVEYEILQLKEMKDDKKKIKTKS